ERVLIEHGLLDHQMSMDEIVKTLPAPSAALTAIVGALQSVIGALGTIIAILVLPYYLLVEAESIHRGLLKLFPSERRPWIARMTYDVTSKVGAWLNGQLLLSAIIGVTASIG